jgi:2,3-bisphosphoglycerate-dependent phosphoglycerate mutase
MIRSTRHVLTICILAVCLFLLNSCTTSISFSGKEKGISTYILVRHAEKDTNDPKDPDLSSAGRIRALKLAELFGEWQIDEFYTSDYKRTRQTIAPLMEIKRKRANTYDPSKLEAFSNQLKSMTNRTIMVVGHSNSTPHLANFLGDNSQFTEWAETEYGNIVIVQRAAGHEAKVSVLKY